MSHENKSTVEKLRAQFGVQPVSKSDLADFKSSHRASRCIRKTGYVLLTISCACFLIDKLGMMFYPLNLLGFPLAIIGGFIVVYDLIKLNEFNCEAEAIPLERLPNALLARVKSDEEASDALIDLLANQDRRIYQYQVNAICNAKSDQDRQRSLKQLSSDVDGRSVMAETTEQI